MMMPFSTGTGLERVGIAGLELELSLAPNVGFLCRKQETRKVG